MGRHRRIMPHVRIMREICRPLAVIGLLAIGTGQSGCVVNDIRDELVRVNTSLDSVEGGLETVRTEIRDVGAELQATNQKLAALDARLGTIDAGLDRTNTRLDGLDNIEDSLGSLDGHLAKIRSLIDGLDRSIPFLNFGSDDDGADTTEKKPTAHEFEESIEGDEPGTEKAGTHEAGEVRSSSGG